MTTVQPAESNVLMVDDPTLSLRLRWAASDTGAVVWRDTIRTLRQPEMLAFAVVMGSFFLVLFNYVFGGSIGAGAGIDYLQFLVPGVLVITALNGAQQTSMGLAADLAEGVTDRFRSLPMSQVAVIAGRTLADAGRNVVGLTLVALLGVLMGYRFGSWLGAVGAVVLCTAMGFAFSWMGAAIAAKVRQPDMVGMLSMFWLFPMMLASTAFTPAETMPGWLQPFARYQPVSTTADAVRGLAAGDVAVGDLVLAAAWIVGMLAVFVPLSVRLYLRPDG
jgi:ABC transporter DrrB family efflux protein